MERSFVLNEFWGEAEGFDGKGNGGQAGLGFIRRESTAELQSYNRGLGLWF